MSVCINLTIYLVYKYSCVVFHTVYVLIIKKDIIKKDINEGTKTAQGPAGKYQDLKSLFVSQEKDSSTKKTISGRWC